MLWQTSESSMRAVSVTGPDRDLSEFVVVDPGIFLRQLAAIAALLVTAGLVVQVVRWKAHVPGDHIGIWFFDLDTEGNLPAFFSAALLVLASGLLALTAALERNGKQRPFWGALAVGFVLMAYDEWTARHEQFIVPMRELLGEWNLALPVFYFAWVVPGTALIAVVSIVFAGFLKRLPRDTRVRFLVAGALYLGGAVGMEMVGSYHYATFGDSMTQAMIAAVEEALEMSGAIYFVHSILSHLANHNHEFRVRFTAAIPPGS